MRRVITRFLMVYPVLASFGFAAIAVGLRQPPSAWSDVLRLNDCELPCWIGIVPGQTAIDEARLRIEHAFGDPSRYEVEQETSSRWTTYRITDKRGGERVGIYLETRDGAHAQVIGLILPGAATEIPTIPELASALGTVSGIHHRTNMGERFATRLWFRGGTVVIEVQYHRCGRVSIDEPVREIYLVGETRIYSQAALWQGFGRCYG